MRSLRAILIGIIHLVIVVGVMAQADFTADETSGCSPLTVKFSFVPNDIDVDTVSFITWDFGFGDTVNALDPDPVVYLEGGSFTVSMTINGYPSTAIVKNNFITVHQTVRANFVYEELAPATFRFIPTDEITDATARYFFMWRYSKSDGSDDRFVDYSNISIVDQETAIDTQSLEIGTYQVLLRVEDTYGCLSQFEITLPVSGGSNQSDFSADQTSGCTPLPVKFSIDPSTVDMDTINFVTWDFGLGDTVNAIDPDTVVYQQGGDYTVSMAINGFRSSTVTKENYISAYQTVRAVFRHEEFAPNTFQFIPLDVITDSTARYFFMWRYSKSDGTDNRSSDYANISYLNQEITIDTMSLDTGVYQVLLRIEDTYGCQSSFADTISIFEEVVLPNVFVAQPGNFYIINPQNLSTILKFQVFNRNGTMVFEQEAPIVNWDGKTTWGKNLVTGVYYYILETIQGDVDQRYSQKGFIHLYQKN